MNEHGIASAVKSLLMKDLLYRLADIRWKKWQRLTRTVGLEWLDSPFAVQRGERFVSAWASANGVSLSDAPQELARRLGIPLTLKVRLLLAEKADCTSVAAAPHPEMQEIPDSPLKSLGFSLRYLHFYETPDGASVSGGVGCFHDPSGNSVRLFLTPWKDEFHRIRWDWLSWGTPLPLYRSHELFAHPERIVFILPSEQDVENLVRDAAGLVSGFPLTTWPGGLQETLPLSDWELLASRPVVIVVPPSDGGARLADALFEQVEKAGARQISFILPEAQIKVTGDWRKRVAMSYDIVHALLRDRTSSRDGFWAFSKREFGLELGPKDQHALPLAEFLSLPVPEQTWLIPELLRAGDRVMVYGVAKSGKTAWVVHETLQIAVSGYPVLYVDGEMGIGDLQDRLKAAIQGTQIPDRFRILSSRALGRNLQLETPEEQMFVLREAKDAQIVVLDNLHALFPSSLQAGPESCEILNAVVDTLHLSGKTVILVHHSSRGGAPFGSSVKELGLELRLKATRKDRDIEITPEAARGLSPEQMTPRRFSIPSFSAPCLEESVSVVEALPAAEAKKDEEDEFDQAIRRELEANPSASCRAIAEKVGLGRTTVAKRMKKHRG